MSNLTPDDISRGLHWADTLDVDPEARHRLANLVVEHQRELLELAARGMRGRLTKEERNRRISEGMRAAHARKKSKAAK